MSAAARLVDCADAVAAALTAAWAPAAPDGVERCWLARLSFDVQDSAAVLQGRRLFVMPVEPGMEALARGYWRNKYTVGVLLAERYTPKGDPPDAWVDARVEWWEQQVLYPLCAPALVLAGPAGVVTQARPDPETPPEVTAFVDRDLLTECKALLIGVNFSFVDGSDHTGAG